MIVTTLKIMGKISTNLAQAALVVAFISKESDLLRMSEIAVSFLVLAIACTGTAKKMEEAQQQLKGNKRRIKFPKNTTFTVEEG